MTSPTTPPRSPELLLPAGSLAKMRAAYDFGADAVYAGQPRYSLRARNNEFRLEQIAQGIGEAHARGKKFFVTSNLLPHNDKVRTYLRDIEPVIALKPDALIMADPGLIMMVREQMERGWPEVPIHLSVQANTVNWASVKFWQKVGVARIILSRELSLDEVEAIRNECPDIELEVFVHGALCIAYSGRCLLSGYFNRRDPNQGTCTNACRWDYKTHAATDETDAGEVQPIKMADDFNFAQAQQEDESAFAACGGSPRHPLADKVYLLEESQRPGQLMPVMEDEHGTYIMNSKDLRAIEHVGRLARIGVDSLKIEGRTKSLYYVARTAQIYRRAIDDAVAGREFNPELLLELESLANRGYTAGFLERRPTQDYQNYISGHSEMHRSQFVAEVVATHPDGWAELLTMNRFSVGDTLEIIHPSGNRQIVLETLQDAEGRPITVSPGNPHRVRMPLSGPCDGALVARMM
ncbi:tRNA 5-hydroxyuridine modification protein YegQ [Leptothrix ochracea]|uniref:prephenate-dependent tRNA uridine(34) hydroxylase TrhP n=2 Tax=Leptothrix ochracea TaxID=735331 RepID=UPI0034E2E0AD